MRGVFRGGPPLLQKACILSLLAKSLGGEKRILESALRMAGETQTPPTPAPAWSWERRLRETQLLACPLPVRRGEWLRPGPLRTEQHAACSSHVGFLAGEKHKALRMKIKEVKKENGDKKIVPKKKKPLKLGPIKKKELKKLVLYLKNGADCPCHQLDNLSHHFLIMGRKVKSQYLLTAIHKWDKRNKEFKNFMKRMKNHECPTFQSVFK
uniref:Secreted frizzled-related protein 1 n=1 Tax=Oryctolagus cuniculus TaxID=9986 RepID=G1TKC8_RABIT